MRVKCLLFLPFAYLPTFVLCAVFLGSTNYVKHWNTALLRLMEVLKAQSCIRCVSFQISKYKFLVNAADEYYITITLILYIIF